MQGIMVEADRFLPIYRETSRGFMEAARRHGRETHNRFWISAALQQVGLEIAPDDDRIAHVVESYFSAFLDHAIILPETLEMLSRLKARYRLGLLSNFTHAPAVDQILSRLGLDAFFDVPLVSGTLGYRKPHDHVFQELVKQFGVPKDQILYVGDDLHADIHGARQAGLIPIQTTYASVYRTSLSADMPVRLGDNPDPPVWTRTTSRLPALPGDTSSQTAVLTISSWDELFVLLELT
jgi:putative hydrolase of the HAD superfamily